MRLDKYLKVSRLIKRRTVANEACDNTRVTVNGKPAKASYDVKVGDHISIAFGARTVTVEVLAVAEAVRKDDAAAMDREILRIILLHTILFPAYICREKPAYPDRRKDDTMQQALIETNLAQQPHRLTLDSRSRLSITGVLEVESFDDTEILLTSTHGQGRKA